MSKLINSIPAKTVNDAFTTAINAALVPLANFKINLTEEQKKNKRSMAEGREGYVRMVSRIGTQFPNSLSRVDTPSELTNLLAYYDTLENNRLALLQALEVIEETQLGASIDMSRLSDRYAKSLQDSRENEGSLDLAMREVDEWNQRFANKPKAKKPADPE